MTSHYDKMFFVDEYVVTRLQTGNWDQEATDEDIEEIGNSGIVETIVDPIIPTTVTLNTNDWGSTDFLAQLMGSESTVDGGSTAYIPAAANRNDWTIDQDEIKTAMVDILVRSRDNSSQALLGTTWIPNCELQSINWSYSVDGNATENVTLRGDTDRHFVEDYRQTSVEIGVFNTTTTFNVTTAGTSHTELYVSINGTIYDSSYVASWATGLVTLTGVPDLTATDRIRFVFYETTASDDFTELDTVGIGAIKAPYVVIGLGDDDEMGVDSTTKTLRLQSVDVNVTLTREDIKEIGTEQVIKALMTKQEVTVDATVLHDDMENLAKMMGVTAATWTAGTVEFKLQDAIGNLNNLYVKVYDDSSQTTLLKMLTITDLALLNNPFSQDVGAQGTYSISLKGDNWLWEGQGDGGRLATSYPTNYPVNQDK